MSANAWILGGAVGVASFVLSLLLVGAILVRLPRDYFAGDGKHSLLDGRPRWVQVAGIVGKNVAGAVLVMVGIVLSLPGVPGQGLLTILVGIILLDIPGKKRLERRILAIGAVERAVTRLRKRYGREPFELGAGASAG
jgi:hypothetical protein